MSCKRNERILLILTAAMSYTNETISDLYFFRGIFVLFSLHGDNRKHEFLNRFGMDYITYSRNIFCIVGAGYYMKWRNIHMVEL